MTLSNIALHAMIMLPVTDNSPYAGKQVMMLPRVAGAVLRLIPA
jgi:hypothetical protein